MAAIVLAALMPTVSRVLAAQPGAQVGLDICSSDHTDTAPGQGEQPKVSIDDCGYCLLMADRLGPPQPATLPTLPAAHGDLPLPPLPWLAIRPDLRLAQPRGPPTGFLPLLA